MLPRNHSLMLITAYRPGHPDILESAHIQLAVCPGQVTPPGTFTLSMPLHRTVEAAGTPSGRPCPWGQEPLIPPSRAIDPPGGYKAQVGGGVCWTVPSTWGTEGRPLEPC